MRKPKLGAVILHPVGTNPYDRKIDNPWAGGDARVAALRQFHDLGALPAGCAAWDDGVRCAITDRDEIDWDQLR